MKVPDRTLPHNLDAERAVLGAILLENEVYSVAVRHLTAADFFRDAHRRIFTAMATLLERPEGACDFTTLVEELTKGGDLDEIGGPSYLAALVDGMPRSTNVRHYAGIVRDKAMLRLLIYAGNKIVAAGYEGDQSAEEILAGADAEILGLRHGRRASNVHALSAMTSGLFADLERRVQHRGQLVGLPTGFKSIDDMTSGWRPGNLVIVAARPSIGKTALAIGTTLATCESTRADGTPRRAIIFSMEMTKEELEFRVLAQLSGINSVKLEGGFLAGNDFPILAAAIERMHAAQLYIDDSPSRTVSDVRAECRQLLADGGLDLVVIDYVQLMEGSLARKGATRNEEITDMSRRLKVLAGELHVPILLLSQLKRIQGRPKLDDLRESGALEQEANLVAFLHRKNHREGGPTAFILEKNRNGPTGEETLTFVKEIARFDDGGTPVVEEPEQDQADEKKARRGKHFARRARGFS